MENITGQAAGLAAAMAIDDKVRPRDIDGKLVRKRLIEEGVALDKAPGGYWKELRKCDQISSDPMRPNNSGHIIIRLDRAKLLYLSFFSIFVLLLGREIPKAER